MSGAHFLPQQHTTPKDGREKIPAFRHETSLSNILHLRRTPCHTYDAPADSPSYGIQCNPWGTFPSNSVTVWKSSTRVATLLDVMRVGHFA